jgi:hypothetical protein
MIMLNASDTGKPVYKNIGFRPAPNTMSLEYEHQ